MSSPGIVKDIIIFLRSYGIYRVKIIAVSLNPEIYIFLENPKHECIEKLKEIVPVIYILEFCQLRKDENLPDKATFQKID